MKKNSRYILSFFALMIAIIFVRILLFIIYEALHFNGNEISDTDSLIQVIFINLTEIALVITITTSIKWTLLTIQQYTVSKNLRATSIEQDNSLRVISTDDVKSHYQETFEKEQRAVQVSLLNDIENLSQLHNNAPMSTRKNYTVFSANDDIRSIFIPHDSVRNDADFHIQTTTSGGNHLSSQSYVIQRTNSRILPPPQAPSRQPQRMQTLMIQEQLEDNEEESEEGEERGARKNRPLTTTVAGNLQQTAGSIVKSHSESQKNIK
jgi:hypothetical protein